MQTPLPPTAENIELAAQLLERGSVVAFPTETVYGLGANAYNDSAVSQIFAIKGRPAHNPLIAHISGLEQLELVTTPDTIRRLAATFTKLQSFIPGPLSLVLPKNDRICSTVSAGLQTVAVRVPRHETALALLRACDFPLAAPSANPSNYISPTLASHVADQLAGKVALILDGGACQVGLESTILDLSQPTPRILRQGSVTAEDLSLALDLSVEQLLSLPNLQTPQVTAPGMLREHYAPVTPIKLLSQISLLDLPSRTGLIFINQDRRPTLNHLFFAERALSEKGELQQVSRNLFRTMREFDTLNLDLIVIEGCEPVGIGRAIMDRLTRASARWAQEKKQ